METTHILLVEDDDDVRVTLTSHLIHEGFAVVAVTDGLGALREIERCRPDLVISDVRMPGMDGMLLLDALKAVEDTADLPIILMSGWSGDEVAVRAFARGATDYVSKPVSPSALVARIRARLGELRRMDSLRHESTVDALTGVHNRRGVLAALDLEMKRVQRGRRGLAVLLIDVDDFKEVNDTLGHQIGDEVLRGLTDTFWRTLRATDVVGRVGGDEFLILLPELSEARAAHVADRLRFAAADVRAGGAPIRISIGASFTLNGEVSADELIRAADAAMYGDKRSSRTPAAMIA